MGCFCWRIRGCACGYGLCGLVLSLRAQARTPSAATPEGIALKALRQQVGRYEKLELAIEVGRQYRHPFDPCEVEIDVLITSPSGRSLVLPAFFGQDYERQDVPQGGKTTAWYYPHGTGSWKARFAPMELGAYSARASLKDRQGEITSAPVTFTCVASSRKGFLRAGTKDPRFLEFTDGEPFFAIGQNLAFIGEDPVRHAGQGRAGPRQAGGQRRQFPAHLDLLPGLGDGHRGAEERVEPLLGERVGRGPDAGPRGRSQCTQVHPPQRRHHRIPFPSHRPAAQDALRVGGKTQGGGQPSPAASGGQQ